MSDPTELATAPGTCTYRDRWTVKGVIVAEIHSDSGPGQCPACSANCQQFLRSTPDSSPSTNALAVARVQHVGTGPRCWPCLGEHRPPAGRVYAMARGHRILFRSPHNP
jgi:hypothetical protein